MNRVREKLAELSAKGRKVLIPFLMAGAPSFAYTKGLIPLLEEKGADLIEIGVPFSDPLADGPVIQTAAQQALEGGFRLAHLFQLVEEVRAGVSVPLVVLIYYNLLFQYGVERFISEAAGVGVDGLVIPDLPPEAAGELLGAASAHALAVNFLIAPTSSSRRIKMIAEHNTGFIYLVSVRGVTGERTAFTSELPGLIEKVQAQVGQPVVVGFGVSGPEQAREVTKSAAGVIIGSAVVKRITREPFPVVAARVGDFITEVRQAIDQS
ncbi:MAG TPA: tryptophan synthase subunit alpha [Firmicutes bacterium]|mgnify:CR=1 FL=1|nr:tryptophan synthase subunit alpha [Bacillota bacterium]